MSPEDAPADGLDWRAWHLPAASAGLVAAALLVAALTGRATSWAPGLLGLALGLMALNAAALAAFERRRWSDPARQLAEAVAALAEGRNPIEPDWGGPRPVELEDLAESVEALRGRLGDGSGYRADWDESWLGQGDPSGSSATWPAIKIRGLLEAPMTLPDGAFDPAASGSFTTADIVNRLDPRDLRWLESSPAEQEFLGWSTAELRTKTFPEIVHPDDRELAREQLLGAVAKGEAHGLIYRVRTARGTSRAIEINAGVRYGPDMAPRHLRCHVTDVTAKVKAGRELRRRTRDLLEANDELRRTNRELEELKDRYRNLYHDAPAMYFTLDEEGRFVGCNDTLARTLGRSRESLVGQPYPVLLEGDRTITKAGFAEFLRSGFAELEGRWGKADGTAIDVWVTATVVPAPDGSRQVRGVAQDVTARRVLEAELREKNKRLAGAVAELSRQNKELDEFSYVVSHDLQEPLRTLIAFSDFLLRDCGDSLNDDGKDYVRHLVDASRRMRTLIRDLLNLSRAGRVTADFAPVELEGVMGVVSADFAELIRTRAGSVRVSGPLPTVWGDRVRIGQLIGNLVGNGLKYHQGPGAVVEVGSVPGGPEGWATLTVKDNGIGIDPQYHAKIFQMFRRLHTREEFEGTGAGLAICQKIVQAHGGRIWVESRLGAGSTFFLTLPCTAAAAAAPSRTPPRTELLGDP